jgi:hypothetical protein
MLLAGVTTILVARPRGEETAEDTVLGVEHWEVLVGNYFEQFSTEFASKFSHLGPIQVVAWGDALKTKFEKGSCTQKVGRVQTEITVQLGMFTLEEGVEQATRAYEEGTAQLVEKVNDTLLIGLEDAGSGHSGDDTRRLDTLDSRSQPVELQIVEGDTGWTQLEGSFELLWCAH